MSLLGCLSTVLKRLIVNTAEDKPIGLKQLSECSQEDLLTQLTTPIFPNLEPKTQITKKALSKAAPAFSPIPTARYRFFNPTEKLTGQTFPRP